MQRFKMFQDISGIVLQSLTVHDNEWTCFILCCFMLFHDQNVWPPMIIFDHSWSIRAQEHPLIHLLQRFFHGMIPRLPWKLCGNLTIGHYGVWRSAMMCHDVLCCATFGIACRCCSMMFCVSWFILVVLFSDASNQSDATSWNHWFVIFACQHQQVSCQWI